MRLVLLFNPDAHKLFVAIFYSFEAGIADLITASNDEKRLYL